MTMKRGKNESGEAYDRRVAAAEEAARVRGESQALMSGVLEGALALAAVDALKAFAELAVREDGWLRMTFDENGTVIFCKWKFTRGKHAGSYAMYRGVNEHPLRCVVGLVEKLYKVDAGTARTTPDHPYE